MSHRLLVLDARDVGGMGGAGGAAAVGGMGPFSPPAVMVHSASTPSSLPSYARIESYGANLTAGNANNGAKFSATQSQHHNSQSMIDDVLTKNLSEMSLESMHGFGYHAHNSHNSHNSQAHQSYPGLQHGAGLDQIWRDPAVTVSDARLGGIGASSMSVGDLNHVNHGSSPPAHSSLFGGMQPQPQQLQPHRGGVAPGTIPAHLGHSVAGQLNGGSSGHQLNVSNVSDMLTALQAQAQQRVALQQAQQAQLNQQQTQLNQQMMNQQAQSNAAIQLALESLGGMRNSLGVGGGVGQVGQVAAVGPSTATVTKPLYSRVGSTQVSHLSASSLSSQNHAARRNHSDPALGGRLARSKMTPAAEAERKAHQDRMYGLDLNKIARGEDKRTTLMIKNIPNKYTQKMLLALLEERFAGIYPYPFDFFYLPIDFKNKCNVGYAFINMTTPHAIPALVEDFHGKRWPKFNSEKVCAIAYGRIQGKLSLIQHFQNSSLLHEDKRCRPILFNTGGEIEAFPIGAAALANFSLKQHAADMWGGGASPP